MNRLTVHNTDDMPTVTHESLHNHVSKLSVNHYVAHVHNGKANLLANSYVVLKHIGQLAALLFQVYEDCCEPQWIILCFSSNTLWNTVHLRNKHNE